MLRVPEHEQDQQRFGRMLGPWMQQGFGGRVTAGNGPTQ